jgi:hypothetical protein
MQMMHKIHTSRIGLWLAMIALLVMVVMPASANDVPTLSDLARYVPADYDVYGAVQIDDATIASVDGLVASVAQRFGEDAPPSVGMVRDMILSNLAPGYTWEDVKDWMGGYIGFATTTQAIDTSDFEFFENEQDSPTLLLIPVTDSAGAQAFVEAIAEEFNLESEVVGDFTVYANPRRLLTPTTALGEDVILIRTTAVDPASIVSQGDSLADVPDFAETLALLPAENYGAVLYVDIFSDIARLVTEDSSDDELAMMQTLGMDIPALFEAIGSQAIGATLLENNTLALDVVANVRDMATLEAMGGSMFMARPANLDWLANVPAGAAFTILSSDFGTQLLMGVEQMQAQAEMLDSALADMGVGLNDDEVGARALDDAIAFALLSYQGMSGQTLEETFGWMTGDIALAANISLGDNGIRFDQATILENTDPEAAQATLVAVQNLLTELGVAVNVGDDGSLLVSEVRELFELIQDAESDLQAIDASMFELVGTTTDTLALSGTRPAVQRVLSHAENGGDSLLDSPAYQRALPTFLPDTQALFFVDIAALRSVVERIPDANELGMVLSVLDSLSITGVQSADGTGVARLSVTLAGE